MAGVWDHEKVTLNVTSETLYKKYVGIPSVMERSKNDVFKYLNERVWAKVKEGIEKILSAIGKEVLIAML